MRAARRTHQRQLRVFQREADDRERLARLLAKHHLVAFGLAVLQLDLAADDFPQFTVFKYHLHLELPRVEVRSIELVDAGGGSRIHGGEGDGGGSGRVCGAWAHNLMNKGGLGGWMQNAK